MSVALHALTERHIPQILEACQDWEELAQHGPPYWRPRNSAELQRKIADTAGKATGDQALKPPSPGLSTSSGC